MMVIVTKKCVVKLILRFNGYKYCLLNNEIILKSQQKVFKSKPHNVYTEEINKIALCSNHDKRLETFDRITLHMVQVLENYVNQSC